MRCIIILYHSVYVQTITYYIHAYRSNAIATRLSHTSLTSHRAHNIQVSYKIYYVRLLRFKFIYFDRFRERCVAKTTYSYTKPSPHAPPRENSSSPRNPSEYMNTIFVGRIFHTVLCTRVSTEMRVHIICDLQI